MQADTLWFQRPHVTTIASTKMRKREARDSRLAFIYMFTPHESRFMSRLESSSYRQESQNCVVPTNKLDLALAGCSHN